MKNRIITKKYKNLLLLLSMMVMIPGFTSCEEEDLTASTPVKVTAVYLEDADSDVPDREVTFARLGQVIRLEGSGFTGAKKVYINGYSTYFNPVYLTDNSMMVQISRETPTMEASEDLRNTIHIVKDAAELKYPFLIRDAAPTITNISHTLPQAGDSITIYGSGLVEIEKITFPGDIVVSEGIVSDPDGDFCVVAVPEGVSEDGGSVLVEGANGGAYSPAYFNCKKLVILDFDGKGSQGFWSWSETGSMIDDTDLKSEVIGEGVRSQGKYVAHRPTRFAEFPAAKNRNSEVWTAGNDVDDWRGQLTGVIPATTPAAQVAFQFDIFVPGVWVNTGYLKILLANNFNGGEWSGAVYNYVPWIENKAIVPFSTRGWVTVTIPFNKFYAYSGTDQEYTFENVLAFREGATYKNFGFYFENSDFKLSNITGFESDETEFVSAPTTIQVYTDNWRVVPLNKPEYTDFPVSTN